MSDMAGMTIGFRQTGNGNKTAIVCLHGIGSNSSGYQAQLRELSDSYRVIAWDAPGYGDSTPCPGRNRDQKTMRMRLWASPMHSP